MNKHLLNFKPIRHVYQIMLIIITRQIITNTEQTTVPKENILFFLPIVSGIRFAFLRPFTTGLYSIIVSAAFKAPLIKLNGKKADILSKEASVMLIRKILNEQ